MEMYTKKVRFFIAAIAPMWLEIINNVDLACYIRIFTLAHNYNPCTLTNIPDLIGIMPVGRIKLSRGNKVIYNSEDFTLSNQMTSAQPSIKYRREGAPSAMC
jgi:hypothetical protein